MNVLIVHAHPEPQSFCAALKDAAVETLASQGHQVQVSDLYAMNFNPVASAEDFRQRENPDYLVYALEQRMGVASNSLAPDIQAEIRKVQEADLLILSFPIFWMSVPAILKGWIDRVFVSGLFYGGKRVYDRGGMAGKRALVCTTLGGRDYMFGAGSLHGELYGEAGMLRSVLQGSLGYVGMEVLEPFVAYHVPYIDDGARSALLAQWRDELKQLDRRPVMAMPSLADFDDTFRPRQASAA
ncbi:MAG: flavodoxin family protein [Rhodocyclaceae bacterium]|nr:MAG: flavodoxin family protein [Rhodocyclaceae bacterium]